jgi:hypothetical protein
MGGLDAGGAPSALNEEYDTILDKWTTRAPMPSPRWRHGVVFSGGKVYAVGGVSVTAFALVFGAAPLSTVDEYDPATDTWTTITSAPTPRWDLGVVAFGGTIWALSGGGPTSYLQADVLLSTGSWAPGPLLSVADSSTCAVAGGKVFVADGPTLYEDDSPSTPFTALPGVYPFGRDGRAVGLGGRFYVLGGVSTTGPATLKSAQSIDPAAPSATSIYAHAPMLTDRAHFATVAWSGKIYVFGGDSYAPLTTPFGVTASYGPIAAVEAYTP